MCAGVSSQPCLYLVLCNRSSGPPLVVVMLKHSGACGFSKTHSSGHLPGTMVSVPIHPCLLQHPLGAVCLGKPLDGPTQVLETEAAACPERQVHKAPRSAHI